MTVLCVPLLVRTHTEKRQNGDSNLGARTTIPQFRDGEGSLRACSLRSRGSTSLHATTLRLNDFACVPCIKTRSVPATLPTE
jgi:hypothetical protein